MKIGSLCSGAGGLDMAVEQVFGAKTAWHCELPVLTDKKGRTRHNSAVDVLAQRWPGVPNHGDLITTNWANVESVDIMCAGWPCQPWSAAGKRLGAEDERAIWPDIANAIRMVGPRIVVLENVPTVTRVGELERVANSLAGIGYDLRWTCLRASDVGAPHQRKRIFILAYAQGIGWGVRDTTNEWQTHREIHTSADHRDAIADSGGDRCEGGQKRHLGANEPKFAASLRGDVDGRGDNAVALLPTPRKSDGDGGANPLSREERMDDVETRVIRIGTNWGKYEPAIRNWERVTRPAPAPTEPNTKGQPRLNPAFSEWMMGWPAGWVTEVPGISRNDQLRIIGNGVVPQCAAVAMRWLLSLEVAT